MAGDDLKSVITPSLLDQVVSARLPFDSAGEIDFTSAWLQIFAESAFADAVRPVAWPALVALSKVGLDRMPDLYSLLPPLDSPSFPRQALGLQLLLDQCPRALFSGIDARWTNGYFDRVSQPFARSLLALPEPQRPHSRTRWAGASTAFWLLARVWLAAPLAHSEEVSTQELCVAFVEESRRAAEEASGTMDLWRARRAEVLSDVHLFPLTLLEGVARPPGLPEGAEITMESIVYGMGMLMDAHKPIIDRFGRYPYANAIRGRDSTAEELEWIERTKHLGEAPPEVARLIREDMEAGRWRPLGSSESSWNAWRDEVNKKTKTAEGGHSDS